MKLDPASQPSLQLPDDDPTGGSDAAANLIRQKLDSLYASEPDVVTEAIESVQEPAKSRSKHQKFMADLAASGKPFAQIQIEWHDYYKALPDREKHEVWEEFYAAQTPGSRQSSAKSSATVTGTFVDETEPVPGARTFRPKTAAKKASAHTIADAKQQIVKRVQGRGKLSRKQHLKSLAFGLAAGCFMMLLLLFGFFNERIIAPFITPSRDVSATPLILDGTAAVGPDPRVIIPKINVDAPVVYDVTSIEEADIQAGLERGVVHYPITSQPGEKGNGAIFGHSSSNILNRGKYKFAFALLNRLELGDTFYIEKDGVRYLYRIFDTKIVPPTDISVLDDVPGKTSTMILVTCDPPGTNVNRLVIWGEQISPDPNQNKESTAIKTEQSAEILAGNAPSLWSRMWNWVF